MIGRIKKLILSHAAAVCAIVTFVAPLISQDCQVLWYQPIEPDGLDDFCR